MFFMYCKNVFPAYISAKVTKKSNEFFFQSYDRKCTATFFYESQCIYTFLSRCKVVTSTAV